jgi:hypothetical protein
MGSNTNKNMPTERVRSPLIAALLATLAACATTAPEVRLSERLDERTGITVTTLDRPLEFFSTQLEYGLDAASFADLGLAETNRMGTRSYFLWLSVLWGRMDPNRLESPILASITVDLGNGSLVFDPARRIDTSAHIALYSPLSDWSEQVVFALTIDEVRAIAHAPSLTLAIATQADGRHQFTLWKPPTETLPTFADELLDGVVRMR